MRRRLDAEIVEELGLVNLAIAARVHRLHDRLPRIHIHT